MADAELQRVSYVKLTVVLGTEKSRVALPDGESSSQTGTPSLRAMSVSASSLLLFSLLSFVSRKKSKCPGERPACAYCVRLGQQCVYKSPAGGFSLDSDMVGNSLKAASENRSLILPRNLEWIVWKERWTCYFRD